MEGGAKKIIFALGNEYQRMHDEGVRWNYVVSKSRNMRMQEPRDAAIEKLLDASVPRRFVRRCNTRYRLAGG
jgi:hypothetical protein